MFVFLFLLFAAQASQGAKGAVDQVGALEQHLKMFVVNSKLGSGLTVAIGSNPVIISSSTDKSTLATTVMSNLYGISGSNSHELVKLESDAIVVINGLLADGTLVVGVNWEWQSQSVTTYAIVQKDASPGNTQTVFESVTSTFSPSPVGVTKSKLSPKQAFIDSYSGSLLDANENKIVNFSASVQCLFPPTYSCQVTVSCTELPVSICTCASQKTVECYNKDTCYAQYAFIEYCGTMKPDFDSTNFEYKNVAPKNPKTSPYILRYKASGILEKACTCEPPK